jgi:protein arginine N-methyltransferase 1
MYSINGYGEMITDDVRTDAYVRALRQAVKPGSVVVDIGTGTGFFAMLACQFGARRVYAVEASDVINVARSMAATNGFAEKMEFIQGMSTDITLPERADVIVSDLRGVLPLFQKHIPAIIDARRRLLAPGGVQIPRSDSLWLACVEAPDLHRDLTTPWINNKYGLDMRIASDLLSNQWHRAFVNPEQLMTQPVCAASIDYTSIVEPDVRADVTVTAKRAGTAHGLCMWFDALLAEGIGFSNSPGKPKLIYRHAFFPWPKPVRMDAGDTIAVTVKSDLIDGEHLWSWETRIHRQCNPGQADIHFKQSEFFGQLLSPDRLRRQSADHVPLLSKDGKVDCLILKMMQDGTSLGDIANRLVSSYPVLFPRWQDALNRVAKLSANYSS